MNSIILLIIIIDVIGLLCIATWLYKDAKAREMNPWGWIALTCLLSPNFIGLIAYLLARRKDTAIYCRQCGKTIDESMHYCPWCGSINEGKMKTLPPKPSYHLLITGIVIMIICALGIVAVYFTQFIPL